MNRVVWKYALDARRVDDGTIELEIPKGARLLCVNQQGGTPTLWALVDPNAGLELRGFELVPTGGPVLADHQYVGTVLLFRGKIVLHLFEVGK